MTAAPESAYKAGLEAARKLPTGDTYEHEVRVIIDAAAPHIIAEALEAAADEAERRSLLWPNVLSRQSNGFAQTAAWLRERADVADPT